MYKNDKEIAASDNLDRLFNLDQHPDKITAVDPVHENEINCSDDLLIIENDKDSPYGCRDYGCSELYHADGEWKILMHKNRLNRHESLTDAREHLAAQNKSYCDDSNTVRGIIGCHLDFWNRSNEIESVKNGNADVNAFQLTSLQRDLLLRTGFSAKNLLLFDN